MMSDDKLDDYPSYEEKDNGFFDCKDPRISWESINLDIN